MLLLASMGLEAKAFASSQGVAADWSFVSRHAKWRVKRERPSEWLLGFVMLFVVSELCRFLNSGVWLLEIQWLVASDEWLASPESAICSATSHLRWGVAGCARGEAPESAVRQCPRPIV